MVESASATQILDEIIDQERACVSGASVDCSKESATGSFSPERSQNCAGEGGRGGRVSEAHLFDGGFEGEVGRIDTVMGGKLRDIDEFEGFMGTEREQGVEP